MNRPEMESTGEPTTADGWTARLELEYAVRRERTVLVRNRHQGPLVVQRSLYPEGEVCHTCILHPPGGVVGGDRLDISILAGEGTSALLTTPGATKFYRSGGRTAMQNQHLIVDENATLEWFPQDTIFFPGAEAVLNTRIDLAPTARFMGWETLCLGLPVNKKKMSSGSLLTRLALYRDSRPLLLDRLRVAGEKSLDRCAGLRGFPVTATFIATGGKEEMLASLHKLTSREKEALYGVTLVDDVLVARYLGHSTFAAHELFTKIWAVLRPKISGRSSCRPRIWST
ncbi:MAG: urease accessory protein UreD [Desulfobulbaceae bacterium]|nr:urease accessory protein UreD [Desulfobulbaceae bacterium]